MRIGRRGFIGMMGAFAANSIFARPVVALARMVPAAVVPEGIQATLRIYYDRVLMRQLYASANTILMTKHVDLPPSSRTYRTFMYAPLSNGDEQ
jgi:hypothetical protein